MTSTVSKTDDPNKNKPTLIPGAPKNKNDAEKYLKNHHLKHMAKEINKKMKDDEPKLQKIDAKSKVVPVHTGLASEYQGKHMSESTLKMDNAMKVAMAVTIIKLQELGDNPQWRNVVEIMVNNSAVHKSKIQPNMRSTTYMHTGSSWFKFKRTQDLAAANAVKAWYVNLIGDADVMKDSQIKLEFIQNIVAASGSRVTSFKNFFYSHTVYKRTLVDVGVIRYPDFQEPYFKLYRLQVNVWADATHVVFYNKDVSGCSGTFNKMIFDARNAVIEKIGADAVKAAAVDLQALFFSDNDDTTVKG